MTPDREGFADPYRVELLFGGPPAVDVATGAIAGGLPADWTVEHRGSHLRIECSVTPDDGASSVLLGLRSARADAELIARAASQSWSWDGAREASRAATHALSASDAGASSLPYPVRLERFQISLVAILRALPCLAIHWIPAGQLVDPAAFVAAAAHEGPRTLLGAINVRMFRIDSYDDGSPLEEPEIVMDTLGLSAIGLDDLQCHFRRLAIDAVGGLLFDTACYLFDRGPVIHGGDSIRGLDHESVWRCEMEDAILAPHRVVIDLNPGDPWAAGPRARSQEPRQET